MSDVLVKVDGVSKKFCKSLKRSLWYGMCDMAREMNPFASPRSSLLVPGSSSEPSSKNQEPRTTNHGQTDPRLRRDEFWAVKKVSFELQRGECLGLIGHNGAGKSTLLKMLNGLIKPDQGRIEMHGRIGALIELGAGFNPILTGRENIYNKGAVLGFTKREVDKQFDEIVDFAEIEDFIDMPVQNYSSGMKVRLGFAVSAQMDPDVLIIDEVLAVGDIGFRIKCLNRINELLQTAAVIFVSHSMPMVARSVSRILLMNHGRDIYQGTDVARGIEMYYDLFETEESRVVGSQKATIHGITVSDQQEDAQDLAQGELFAFSYNEKITVNLAISLQPEVSEYSIALLVIDKNLQQIAAVSSRGEDFFVQNPGGEAHRVSISFPNLFTPGTYTMTISLLSKTNDPLRPGEVLASYRNIAGFKSKAGHLITHVPVQLQGEWVRR
jgi:lipopolysaccharide transport system ATP-binding protein